ncbi:MULTISPECIES: LysR family transcriptional regulator [unclassified Roseovarius]|uniref:LysR family transcriptional regulator n=1 Tax=unclassified Roseovarius TaxID=2614913 RepID=UPI00273DCD5C|nr:MULTISPECIES: LysR family transcriptional regulator [unclassified Roseovarius]
MKPFLSHQTLRRIVYFEAIATAGSIRGAAEHLGLSVPVLSEALSELEEDLGVSLATRSTRRFQLTEAGQHVHGVSQQIVELAMSLPKLNRDTPLSGTLHITLPVELSTFWLPERLRRFRQIAPEVEVRITATDELETLNTSPIELALRTTYSSGQSNPESAMSLDLTMVASKAPTRDGERFLVPLIDVSGKRWFSPVSVESGREEVIGFAGTVAVNNHLSAISWARQGLGAALVIRDSVREDLAEGRLIEIMPDYIFGAIDMKWVFRDRLPSRNALAFVEAAAADGL